MTKINIKKTRDQFFKAKEILFDIWLKDPIDFQETKKIIDELELIIRGLTIQLGFDPETGRKFNQIKNDCRMWN